MKNQRNGMIQYSIPKSVSFLNESMGIQDLETSFIYLHTYRSFFLGIIIFLKIEDNLLILWCPSLGGLEIKKVRMWTQMKLAASSRWIGKEKQKSERKDSESIGEEVGQTSPQFQSIANVSRDLMALSRGNVDGWRESDVPNITSVGTLRT